MLKLLAFVGLGLVAASGAQAECPPGAPTGVYEGVAGRAPSSIELTVNLVCADGRYQAQIFSSIGDLPVREASGSTGHARLATLAFGAPVTIEVEDAGDRLSGSFAFGASRGPLELRRAGAGVPPDRWGPRLDLTPAQWREDLKAFAAGLAKRHANAFAFLSKPEFEREIARLDARLDRLNGDQAYVELNRIANAIGDGHTYVDFPPDRAVLPFQIRKFGDDFRIVAAGPGLERALGAKLLKIGPTPIAEAWRRALTLTPSQELPPLREGRALSDLRLGIVLHGLGLTPDRDDVVLTLQPDHRRAFTLPVKAWATGETQPLTRVAAAASALPAHRPDESFWCEALAGQATLYCAWNGYGELQAKAAAMFALIDKTHPQKLILDMRANGGGDNTEGYRWIVAPLKAREDLNRKGRLYVLVGAQTFSAAMNNAAQFQDLTQAILAGQEIGEKPNSYQEPRAFRLPNSHLQVRASSLYYAFRKTGPNVVRPEKEIAPTWADVKAGRDPVLDWVLAQPAP